MKIEIQKKTQPIFLLSMVIVLLVASISAVWILIEFIFSGLQGFWGLKISAVVAIAGATIWAIYQIIQQASKARPGLTIDEQGITDYSNMASVGFIPWGDITSIQEAENVLKQKLIVVVVKNPDVYINKPAKLRESRRVQYQQFGSPIIIAGSRLGYDTQELVSILKNRVRMKSSWDF